MKLLIAPQISIIATNSKSNTFTFQFETDATMLLRCDINVNYLIMYLLMLEYRCIKCLNSISIIYKNIM